MALTKAEQAYEILRTRIVDGTLSPGHRIVIDQLGREYGISSVPWREAIRRLEAEGWVEIVPNAGAVVRRFDTGEWMRTLRFLARIEALATSLSVEHLTSGDLDRAEEINDTMRRALEGFDTTGFARGNREFHRLLCAKCDDPRLLEFVETEWMRMDVIRRAVYWNGPGRAVASIGEHAALVDLIRSGADPDLVETAARQHELNTLEAVAAYDAATV